MKMFQKKKKMLTPEQAEEIRIQEFFDRIVPSTVRFFTDHFICGNSCQCGNGQPQPKNKRFWHTLQTEIL